MKAYWPLVILQFYTWNGHASLSLEELIRKSKIPAHHLSIWAKDSDSQEPLWNHRSDIQVEPASLTKILTAAAALTRLGPDTSYETSVFTDSAGAAVDTLTIVGQGDPSIVSEHFWTLSQRVFSAGLRRVRKRIIVDDSYFDQVRFDEDRESQRVDRAYDAPIGGLSFNWNSVSIFVRPGATPSSPAVVFLDPEMQGYLSLSNSAKTGKNTTIEASRQATSDGDLIVTRGTIAISGAEKVIYKSISKPDLWAAHQLKAFLQRAGIQMPKEVIREKIQTTHKRASVRGLTVADQVLSMMKFSSNYVAEMLTKQMAVQKKGQPGNMKNGLEEIRLTMDELGLKRSDYTIINPSGLTDGNRISTRALGHVLDKIDADLSIAPEFRASLPIFGVDGTVKSRLLGTRAQGRIRAKTGLLRLSGVVGLAGYAITPSGKKRSFAFLYNRGSELKSMDQVKGLFDRLCLELTTRDY